MTVFGVKTSDVKPEKLPTIRQYCKSTAKSKYKDDGVVELVWLPNQFKNITLQTRCFRILIPERHPFYEELGKVFAGINDRSCGIRVEVSNWKTADYVLHELSEGDGRWEAIGDTGLRFVER
jgi:hypothetical protein